MTDEQLSLFSVADATTPYRVGRSPQLEMSQKALCKWKQRIANFQQQAQRQIQPDQGSLIYDVNPQPDHWNAAKIDPFALPPKPWNFYRERYDPLSEGQANIYFVLDHAVPLLLYVGETKLSVKQRWQGVHDCKDYIDAYVSLHRKHGLDFAVNMAFNVSVPKQNKQRLALEKDLILRWRSPFNKECWQHWGQPFQRRS
ncbi:MAG: GIY-YIG nuclease family protein [Limnothrix sp.]